MTTAGVINGTLMRLYLDEAAGSTYTVLGNSLDVTLNVSHSPRETTNQGSAGDASFLEGKRVRTIDFNCLQAEDGAHNFWLLYAVFADSTKRAKVTGKITTAASGDGIYTFTGYITSLSMPTGGPEGNVQMSGSIQVTGAGTASTNP